MSRETRLSPSKSKTNPLADRPLVLLVSSHNVLSRLWITIFRPDESPHDERSLRVWHMWIANVRNYCGDGEVTCWKNNRSGFWGILCPGQEVD